jgi:serine phosphatase RsbU (regulator of sigma subunit)
MIGIDPAADVPATVRYHQHTIEQIVQSVEEGVYCALLGPRLCGKTLLLRYVEQNLANLLGWTCIYLDLQKLRATTQQAFFADLTRVTALRLGELTSVNLRVPNELQASSAIFRAFLSECLYQTNRDLVLIIDPLEALPTDLVQALLTSLRAAYMDQQNMDHQVIVVVSGALSLATLTVGESSPFRGIANRVFVDDLSMEDSQALILENLQQENILASRVALSKLLMATSGDIFLVRKLSQCCVDLANLRSTRLVRARDVAYITNRFLRSEVFRYAPLLEAVRLIEENPDLLYCILKLLEVKRVHRTALPLPLSPDLDPLYLTGVVERTPGDYYQIQNMIYHQFLSRHFTPGRVGHVLAMSGYWDSAMDYLHVSIQQGSQQSRTDLLPATINSMYAADDLVQAAHYLKRGLTAAFGVREAQVWFCPPQDNFLHIIGPAEQRATFTPGAAAGSKSLRSPESDNVVWSDLQIPLAADRLEARAYRQHVPLRGQERDLKIVRAIPLMIPGQKAIGVVTIFDDLVNEVFVDIRERDQQLVGFLNQAARALQTVNIRRQELVLAGRVQASLLPHTPPEMPGWQVSATWKPARETSGDFYDFIPLPGGKLAIVIADVVDKGMGPALLMTLTRTLIRGFAQAYPEQPDQLLRVTNQRIIEDINMGIFVTLFYGVLDPITGHFTYCNAGHPPPVLLAQNRVVKLQKTGMALGVSEEEDWKVESVEVAPANLLLLYTDGVLDARASTGDLFGEAHLIQTLKDNRRKSANEIQTELMSGIFNFAGSEPQVDDITLIAIVREPANLPAS